VLTHVVMIRLADPSTAPRLVDLLTGLVGQVPGLRSVQAGPNVVPSARAWDFGFVALFDDEAALAAYQVHPAHVAVAGEIRAAATEIAAVDLVADAVSA
jgi:hypothetical protein